MPARLVACYVYVVADYGEGLFVRHVFGVASSSYFYGAFTDWGVGGNYPSGVDYAVCVGCDGYCVKGFLLCHVWLLLQPDLLHSLWL